MTKADLRREMRQRLRALGPERDEKSRALVAAIAAHPAFLRSRHIAIFSPLPSEPDVEMLWETGRGGFCYPRIAGDEIEFVTVVDRDHLWPAAWNPQVREPASADARIVPPAKIGLLLVPGLAFTRDGQRLGRGGGFYDRFLPRLPAGATKLGICFDLQMVEALPVESHDWRVDAVVTERGLLASSH